MSLNFDGFQYLVPLPVDSPRYLLVELRSLNEHVSLHPHTNGCGSV